MDEADLRRWGRAVSDDDKRELLDALLRLWTRPLANHLRLGQLLANALREEDVAQALYTVEDRALVERIEELLVEMGS